MEMVVSIGILTLILVGFLSLLQTGMKLATENKGRTGALSLATEKMEYMRSLPYGEIGVVGGNPAGIVPPSKSIALNGITYTRKVSIAYIDDPKDGLGALDSNGITHDYKRARVVVSWKGPSNESSVYIDSDFSPVGIEKK